MPRKFHVQSAAATDTAAKLIEAFKVSDRDKQRLHQRSRVASSVKNFEWMAMDESTYEEFAKTHPPEFDS